MRDPGTVCYNVTKKRGIKCLGVRLGCGMFLLFVVPLNKRYVRHFGKVNGCIKQTISYPSMLNITT